MSKPAKNSNINIRISDADKLKYAQEAKNLGMDLSKYIMHLLEHKEVRIIEGGKELAHAIYDLNNLLPYPSEFVYNESESVLYWCQFGTDKCKRLANFEVVISRRFRLVSCDRAVDALGIIVLRGRKTQEFEISLSELSMLMQRIERSFPEYRLYPDSRQQGVLFRQYVSEVYERTANSLPIDLVYRESGWHLTAQNVPHYYSGTDLGNCLSNSTHI